MSVKNNLKTNFNRHCEGNITTEESTLLLSSLCLTRRSTELNSNGCPIGSGMTRKGERGRSMVEMLGVLAIIGVLSVGGISAYGVAMKKHKFILSFVGFE